jgi:sigma-B regulation protein RsbU (phosphoserine phosphatase)
LPLSSREPVRGIVSVTRDGGSIPFDDDDIATIVTCIGYAKLAVESTLRYDAEQLAERAVNAERERIARFQQEMLAIVGHDLRTPLEAILIGTELLAADLQHEPACAYVVTRIESSAKRMTRMVDQLLDMTRARLGNGIPLVRRRTRLLPLIKSVIAELALAHTGARFEVVAVADVVGLWDPDRLGQVATNLISNAMQYGPEGGPIIVGVTCKDGLATIAVHNQFRSKPIPPEALSTLFDPYRRGDHPHNARGLGLGLYIVHEIVKAHGGTIDVESLPSGTTFRVVLPDAQPAADMIGRPGPPAASCAITNNTMSR